jgi:Flp pilus assembly protein TadG
MGPVPERLAFWLRSYRRDQHGAAAAEFALILILLVVPFLSVLDIGLYSYERMELENATHSAAQAAWAFCSSPTQWPATANSYAKCPGMSGAVATAAHSTGLGAKVSVSSIQEGYYCINTSTSALAAVGTFPGTKPSDCSSVGSSKDSPGDYVQVNTSVAYTPVFDGISIGSLFTSPITSTAWIRLG